MTIQEAIKTNKPFRLVGDKKWYLSGRNNYNFDLATFCYENILSDKWEVLEKEPDNKGEGLQF